jgi:hypothetical protein
MREQAMQGQEEIDPEVTEFVDGPEESREDASHPAEDGRRAETPGEQEAGANFGAGTEEQRKEAKRRRDLDNSGADIRGIHRKPTRLSRAEKRRIEEEERESLDKAMRASREYPAPKRKNANEDLDAEEKFGRFERSRTVSLDTDAATADMAVEAQMQDLDSMEIVYRKIIAATILGVDITEVYSPERVAEVARRYGLVAGSSMDLTTGFDFTKESDRQLAWKRVKEETPFVLIGSPPRTYFSMLQELNIATNKHKPGWMQNFEAQREKAKQHVNFCCSVYRHQIDQGRHFVHEHPWSARSWALPSIQQMLNHPSVQLTQTHMCRFVMETHIE